MADLIHEHRHAAQFIEEKEITDSVIGCVDSIEQSVHACMLQSEVRRLNKPRFGSAIAPFTQLQNFTFATFRGREYCEVVCCTQNDPRIFRVNDSQGVSNALVDPTIYCLGIF